MGHFVINIMICNTYYFITMLLVRVEKALQMLEVGGGGVAAIQI